MVFCLPGFGIPKECGRIGQWLLFKVPEIEWVKVERMRKLLFWVSKDNNSGERVCMDKFIRENVNGRNNRVVIRDYAAHLYLLLYWDSMLLIYLNILRTPRVCWECRKEERRKEEKMEIKEGRQEEERKTYIIKFLQWTSGLEDKGRQRVPSGITRRHHAGTSPGPTYCQQGMALEKGQSTFKQQRNVIYNDRRRQVAASRWGVMRETRSIRMLQGTTGAP